MRDYLRVNLLVPLLILVLLPLGCGKGYQVAPVSGLITLDGSPAANAELRFVPIADSSFPASTARTDNQGKYTLHLVQEGSSEGAVVGEHRVVISAISQKVKTVSRGPMSKMKMRDRIPPSQLEPGTKSNGAFIEQCTVPPEGKADANFNLKSE